LYDGTNYAGSSKAYPLTSNCNNDLESSFNDMASSLKITSGCVRLFKDKDCAGGYKEYSANTASLTGINDAATSFSDCSTPVLTLYSDSGYAGSSKQYTVTNVCNNDLAISFNDVASSLKLTSGCVRLYNDVGCTGGYVQYTGDSSFLSGINDGATSFSDCTLAAPILTLFEDPNYEGASKEYPVTSTCSNAIHSNFNDMASSLKLASGCVRLYGDTDCTGTYEDFYGDSDTIPTIDDDASSFRSCP
jgi:hypothetical protein